ncbi:phage major capsid protein, HK97 family [Klebsiella pneumoniae]|uniref:Phage major capsid protein, HK97 family n=1 Tax=Klebsiella pneumoniae TaxID=573 RepID=A0A378FVC7_KLEPN|nr:phage major capsid protein, HK97 family [Klebsiella pneumoniae]
MKKLLELRQQKAALKTQMRSMLEKADSEKRSLNEEEGKKFDELRAQADALEVEISVLKPSPTISAISLVLPLKVSQ